MLKRLAEATYSRWRRQRLSCAIGAVFALGISLFVTVGELPDVWRLVVAGETAVGEVAEDGGCSSRAAGTGIAKDCGATIRYTTEAGEVVTQYFSVSSSQTEPGTQVSVHYDPNDPTNARTDTPSVPVLILHLALGPAVLLCLLVGVSFVLWGRVSVGRSEGHTGDRSPQRRQPVHRGQRRQHVEARIGGSESDDQEEEEEEEGVVSSLPPPPLQPLEKAASADWYADPYGQHRLRYWNGTAWTDNVTD